MPSATESKIRINLSQNRAAVPKRLRKKLSDGFVVAHRDGKDMATYEGIPAQMVANTIRACKGGIMPERLARRLIGLGMMAAWQS